MNEHFEQHRATILHIRQELSRAQYRERMRCLARGQYASEAEALEGLQVDPPAPTDDEVRESLGSNIAWALKMRTTAKQVGDKWTAQVRERWLREADRIELHACMALSEGESS